LLNFDCRMKARLVADSFNNQQSKFNNFFPGLVSSR
jgi:hypothetical protein